MYITNSIEELGRKMKSIKENRWYIYQKERFPVGMYSLMILAFSTSAVGYASLLRGAKLRIFSLVVSFITSFTIMALLRIADEHKDFEEDSKYRPYRPVPRGLVKLSELRNIGIFFMILELILAISLNYTLIFPLLLAWIYLLFMRKEFFCGVWLRAHPTLYMLTHMLIMPILDFYATACDFAPAHHWELASRVLWYISSSFFSGIVIEVGRKMRAPQDEERGVQTYSKIWGRKVCLLVWSGSQLGAAITTLIATYRIDCWKPAMILLPIIFVLDLVICIIYVKKPTSKNSKMIEMLSGVWAISEYTAIGILPLIFK